MEIPAEGTGTVPVTYRERHSGKICWSEISQLFIFAQLYTNETLHTFQQLEHLLNNYFQEQLYNRKRSVTASEITKIFKL